MHMALPNPSLSPAEYLRRERAGEAKHEYDAGEIWAMVGASLNHNLIAGSLFAALYGQLRGKPCHIFPSDMRLKTPSGLYAYPDISVVCGEAQFEDSHQDTLLNPVVLVEVLSPPTERYDRGRKFQHYRTLPTLRDVLLVAQDSPRVEQYSWQAGRWTLMDVGGNDGVVQMDSIGCVLPLTAIYEQVNFDDAR
jgi:Uma2 family endonuclease